MAAKTRKNPIRGYYLENVNFERPEVSNEELFQFIEDSMDENEVNETLDALIKGNKGLVHHMIHKLFINVKKTCEGFRITPDDLFQLGMYGLWKSVLTYNVSLKILFATYATRCIANEILMFVRLNKRHNDVDSYDTTLQFNHKYNGDDTPTSFSDMISDPNNDIDNFVISEYESAFLKEFDNKLTHRERIIVKMYFMDDLPQKDVAKALNVSQSYISRLIDRIVDKGKILKNKLEVGV